MHSDTTVSVLGLGAMGHALARAFLDAGHPTTVWNRTPGRAAGLDGARVAGSAAEAVAASPLVVVCLVDPDAADAVLASTGTAPAGRTVVDLTNTSPGRARDRAHDLSARGASAVDGGIMATPPMIGGPYAMLLLSGDREAFERSRDVLSALGETRFVGDDPGSAALYDLALLSGMYGMFGGALHAFGLARSSGLRAAELAPMLEDWLRAMLTGLKDTAAEVDDGATGPATSPLAMQAAGFVNLRTAATELGMRNDLLAGIGGLIDEAVAAGHGDEDIAAVAGLLRSTSR
jgi:3-hydroxyisobutyrate dehydrogenase-like beta-hydroxyacid dehydrogenase